MINKYKLDNKNNITQYIIYLLLISYLLYYNYNIHKLDSEILDNKKYIKILFYSIYLIISILFLRFYPIIGIFLLLIYFLNISKNNNISHFMGQLGTGKIISFNSNNNKLNGPGMNNDFSLPGTPGIVNSSNFFNNLSNTSLNLKYRYSAPLNQRKLPLLNHNENIIQYSYITPSFLEDKLLN